MVEQDKLISTTSSVSFYFTAVAQFFFCSRLIHIIRLAADTYPSQIFNRIRYSYSDVKQRSVSRN